MPHTLSYVETLWQNFSINALLPLIILTAYTLFGAFIFRHLEREYDEFEREQFRNSTQYAIDQVTRRVLEIRCDDSVISANHSLQLYHARVALDWFVEYLNLSQTIADRSDHSPWSWYMSMFYAGQLYTTIGYGFPIAKTRAGQIFSIFYILIGIPIFLIILKDVGQVLSKALRKIFKRLRVARNILAVDLPVFSDKSVVTNASENLTGEVNVGNSTNVKNGDPFDRERSSQKYRTTVERKKTIDDDTFPIPLALSILVIWTALSAALFCLWETEWGYMTSVYFFFVSISTVGLGDIVPRKPDMMLVNFILILIGLALLSMCINLIQITIERTLNRLLRQYIEEIEKLVQAQPATGDMEIGLTGNLLAVPFAKQEKSLWSLQRNIKEWVAGKIADNLLATKVKGSRSSSKVNFDKLRSTALRQVLPCSNVVRAMQILEKSRLNRRNDDFHSVLLSKFITSPLMEKFVEEQGAVETVDCAVQTHPLWIPSNISLSNLATPEASISTRDDMSEQEITESTYAFDSSSLCSVAFYDRYFDGVPSRYLIQRRDSYVQSINSAQEFNSDYEA